MNADSIFLIGASHDVCQDYAIAGRAGDDGPQANPYVILSDGCSSSPDTDVGARLLVKAAAQTLMLGDGPPAALLGEMHAEAARRALDWAERAGLHRSSVDATLLTIHLLGGELLIGCTGDGVIYLESRSGARDLYSVSYSSGYPLYPGYAHQPDRLLSLADAGSDKEVRHFHSAAAGMPLLHVGTTQGGPVTEVLSVCAEDYVCAAVFSDGVHSFFSPRRTETCKGVEPVPLGEVVEELVGFRTVMGAFVRRRMKKVLKDCLIKGWRHTDDLSVGALHLGGEACR